MRAEIEIDIDTLLGSASRETLRVASSRDSSGAKAISDKYITYRDSSWFIIAAREADAKIRAALSSTITTESSDISDQTLIYNIECRDEYHGQRMAALIEQSLIELICNSWYLATYQPQQRFDIEIVAELKSNAFITKRVRRKYSIY